MAKVIAYCYAVGFIGLGAIAHVSYAVCLDPKTFVSGYHVPLPNELRSTKVIVIGKVVQSRSLQEDAADPEGVTAYLYTVEVLRQLKGHVPKMITLRNENNSGRYPIDVGEEHLLFLRHEGKYFGADPCGNSSRLPEGSAVRKRVEAQVAKTPHAP